MCTTANGIQWGCGIIIRITEIKGTADIDSQHTLHIRVDSDMKIPPRVNPGTGLWRSHRHPRAAVVHN